ncbi:hypothetical protein K3152_00405 [Qipengyuania sp. 1NDH17]|uniref:Uncharacterized protein n=1 Tax=Qipengyuania polymorpha TaxID=2867234 RepID=A0ABS7ITM9_9SPHN|nr:hypothetical protein [Qipengyuania polymorpha]MBX7456697.1 hypothetical protein [Qipengyuania polymorpha]
MKFAKLALASVALIATPALANGIVEGATVTGPEGNTVGTVVAIEGGNAIIDTGKHKIPLPASMYVESDAGLTLPATKAMLDGMIDQQIAAAKAQLDAALVVGASAMAADHAPLGTITLIEGDEVTIARGGDETNVVVLLRGHFTAGDHGLMAKYTNAEIDAAMAANAPAEGEAAE